VHALNFQLTKLFLPTKMPKMLQTLLLGVVVAAQNLQPKVITVESQTARKVYGSVSSPKGSPWCQGRPMYWLVGHQVDAESPYCLTENGWVMNPSVVLDSNDPLNDMDRNSAFIDRHDCTAVDADGDGVKDLVCGVGADKGLGYGYNEVYITQRDGTLIKDLDGHGLQRYPTLRVRFVDTLSDPFGNPLVFLATHGTRRADHATNTHKLFRRVFNKTEGGKKSSYFFEDAAKSSSPLTRYSDATVVVVADFNGDKIDDLLIGNRKVRSVLLIQNSDGSWEESPIDGWRTDNWRSAKVADFTGDGIDDLIVSDWGGRQRDDLNSTIRIFRGLRKTPYFDFTSKGVIFETTMPYAAPDIEVFDANDDGFLDVYVVQTDEVTPKSYCAADFDNRKFWGSGNDPPARYIPPLDEAHDYLLLGKLSGELAFHFVKMVHEEPGCGFMVERFQKNSLVLAQGTRDRPGHNLLLEW
jgi:FG-GAP-like repeat